MFLGAFWGKNHGGLPVQMLDREPSGRAAPERGQYRQVISTSTSTPPAPNRPLEARKGCPRPLEVPHQVQVPAAQGRAPLPYQV